MRPLIVIIDSVFSSYREEKQVLKTLNARLQISNPQTNREIIKIAEKADAVLVNLHNMNQDVIGHMRNCRVISRYGVGVDNVDLAAATLKKIWVANVPDYCVAETADHALALLFACLHSVVSKDRLIRKGYWKLENRFPLPRLSHCVLGIIGYGKTGRALHKKASGLGLSRILICDPYVEAKKMVGGEKVRLEELLRRADFISLHLPLTEETFHLLGNLEFRKMKKTAILINTSRGAIIDERALTASLKARRIRGAGLDVFEKEPLSSSSELLSLENVVLSDHTAYYSEESVKELKTKTAMNVVGVFKKGKPYYPVNDI